MNFLDVLIIIPAIWAGFRGFKNGLVKEVFSLIAFVLGLYLSYRFSNVLGEKIDSSSSTLIAFAIIFTATLALTFLVGRYVDKVIKIIVPDFIDRLCGICFGILKVVMICSALLYLIQQADDQKVVLKSEVVQDSVLYEYVEKTTFFLTSQKEEYDRQEKCGRFNKAASEKESR